MYTKDNFLNEKIEKSINKPGCYLFKDINNEIIYIGKAKELKKRIKQHFLNKNQNEKTKLMISKIVDFEIIITNNEKEALILEHNLIKKNLPKYNIILSDDRTYPYIFIPKVKNPYYLIIWKKIKIPGLYFGPFPDKYSVKEILNLLQTLFPLWRCYKFKNLNKSCFYYQINQCSGNCFKEVKKEYYDEKIKLIKDFFDGKLQKINKEINTKIKILNKNLQFEQTDKLQKLLIKIKEFNNKQNIELNSKLNADFINYSSNINEIAITIFSYRSGKLIFKKENKFSLYNNKILEVIIDFLMEYYNKTPIPKLLIIPKGIELSIFKEIYKIKIWIPKIGQKSKILNLVKENSEILLKNIFIKSKLDIKYNNLIKLKEKLDLNKIPKKIEFLDFSYIDENIIACFIKILNGHFIPAKTKFYEFEMKNQNEKKYFYNVILKHYKDKELPNLLILDGGILQIQGTKKALLKLNIQTNIIGLVKNKKHQTEYILNSDFKKYLFNKNSELFKFLSNIQNLGHQIVINKLRKKNKL